MNFTSKGEDVKSRLHQFLFSQVDNSALIVFRIFFGLIVFLECAGAIFTGWVKEALIDPQYPITFIGFEWVALPGNSPYLYYAIMALCGIMIAAGFFYRTSTLAFTLLWWGSYLMQKTHYNNHYYLLVLLAFFMMVVPAHRYFSLDVKRNPAIKSLSCPRWCTLIFILQLWIVFTYAGLAKINPDWMDGKPISIWFDYKTDYPVIGFLFEKNWFKWMVVYGGILFDLLIVPLLLWKRTRTLAFFLCLFFNIFNSVVFQIGAFPYLIIVLTVFFFPAEKIRSIFFKKRLPIEKKGEFTDAPVWKLQAVSLFWIMYFCLQIFLPLRHLLYKGDVSWTEEGYRMSWQMMLRAKSGKINFEARDPASGNTWKINLEEYFTIHQIDQIAKKPDVLWQSVQLLKKIMEAKGVKNVEIYAYSELRLNGGLLKPLIHPQMNLAKIEWKSWEHSEWLLDYEEVKK